MPLPRTKDVGALMRFLKAEKPEMQLPQRLAIALERARRNGAKIRKKGP